MIDIVRLGAIFTASVAVATGLWTAGDYTGVRPIIKKEFITTESRLSQLQLQLDQASTSIVRLTFENLLEKQKHGGLTFEEQKKLCESAAVLGYRGVPGC